MADAPKKILGLSVGQWQAILVAVMTAVTSILGTIVATEGTKPDAPVVVPVPAPKPSATPVPAPTGEPTPAPKTKVKADPISSDVWIPTDAEGKRIDSVALESLAATLTDGNYVVTKVPGQGEPFKTRTVSVYTSGVPPPKPVDPTPPGPKPNPDVPILGDGFKVLILEDRETNRDLPSAQLKALQSSELLSYLDRKCPKVDGVPEWRKWDDNLTPDRISEDEPWKARYTQAYNDSKGARPWVYATNGKAAISIKFPADEPATMAELKKIGGE